MRWFWRERCVISAVADFRPGSAREPFTEITRKLIRSFLNFAVQFTRQGCPFRRNSPFVRDSSGSFSSNGYESRQGHLRLPPNSVPISVHSKTTIPNDRSPQSMTSSVIRRWFASRNSWFFFEKLKLAFHAADHRPSSFSAAFLNAVSCRRRRNSCCCCRPRRQYFIVFIISFTVTKYQRWIACNYLAAINMNWSTSRSVHNRTQSYSNSVRRFSTEYRINDTKENVC